eukprot:GEZU01001993.1.p1 GENE.GEZU01001993.1~~GEZU01001993.1.p1  ORF type:complete len:417 (+),score=134.91 GEZU01001993.1:1203-2453(+)
MTNTPLSVKDLNPLDVCIVGSARTAIGGFGGSLSTLTATELGGHAIKGAIASCGKQPGYVEGLVEEVFMGNVLSANLGQAPARQAAHKAGIPDNVPCTTLNKVCSSGMKAIMFGAQSIMLGQRSLVVCGGMESMSNTPYYLPTARHGQRMGNGQMVDGMIHDGLWDFYHNFHMGEAAELCAEEYKIGRPEQDEYAKASYQRAIKAYENNEFQREIVPVEVKSRGQTTLVTKDDEFQKVDFDKIPQLRPAFRKVGGTVTAANASTISDGAAAVVLASAEFAQKHGLPVLAVIRGFDDAEQKPERFTTSPALAIPKALKRAKLDISDVDYFEINEAFAVVSLANMKLLNLDPSRVNIYGGACALGHPLGASGCRIVNTLITVLHNKKANIGCAGICNGGGGASAIVIQRVVDGLHSAL